MYKVKNVSSMFNYIKSLFGKTHFWHEGKYYGLILSPNDNENGIDEKVPWKLVFFRHVYQSIEEMHKNEETAIFIEKLIKAIQYQTTVLGERTDFLNAKKQKKRHKRSRR